MGIFFEYLPYRYKTEIKREINNFRNIKLKTPKSPKNLMYISVFATVIFITSRQWFLASLFFILSIIFYFWKIYLSGDWKVYYKEKYGFKK